MLEKISLIFVNSSSEALDNLTSVLKSQIESAQRPSVVSLSYNQLVNSLENGNLENLLREFIAEKLTRYREALEKSQQLNEFNQLKLWREMGADDGKKSKRKSSRIKREWKSQLCTLKRDTSQRIILDFPLEHEVELFLVLFEVYDVDAIKIISSLQTNGFKVIVNLCERDQTNCPLYRESFWDELLTLKHTGDFENFAFIDLDVPPIKSQYMLNVRSKLIYDQFSHFIYDIEFIKAHYRSFCERLKMQHIEIDIANGDLIRLQNRINEIPVCMQTVECIYEQIMQHISNTPEESQDPFDRNINKFQSEAYGRRIYDMSDKWAKGSDENPKFYSGEIAKLEILLSNIWQDVPAISMEKSQVLNYFLKKVARYLRCHGKGLHRTEFYFYVMQFAQWKHATEEHELTFYESRSVGHEKSAAVKNLKSAISDENVDYKNVSRIPNELQRLMNVRDVGNFYVKFYSQPAMLQHLHELMEVRKDYCRKHMELFDVVLLKFDAVKVPKSFVTRTYDKILPTPLCFRDFNDYMSDVMPMNCSAQQPSNDDGDGCNKKSGYKADDFILNSSIKHSQLKSQCDNNGVDARTEDYDAGSDGGGVKLIDEDIYVYNVSNNRTQFHVTESALNSFNFTMKASVFNWFKRKLQLNLSATLHGNVHLSYSHDLRENKFMGANVTDNHSGVLLNIASINAQHNLTFSFPHEIVLRIIDVHTVELTEHSPSSSGEVIRRLYFSNGFVMIHKDDGVKIYSSNGTIFEIVSTNVNEREKVAGIEALTQCHEFSIKSIHFLAKYINLSAFIMTVPSGRRFSVKNDVIVEEVKPVRMHEWRNERTGNCYSTLDDGIVRSIHAPALYTKLKYPDGTVITTTYDCEEIATACSYDAEVTKPISILDEIWRTEAEKESQIVVDDVLLNCITDDDYFQCINQTHCFEHKTYGSMQFHSEGIEMKLHGGISIDVKRDLCFNISLTDGISLRLDSEQLHFYDEKCGTCARQNKVSINVSQNDVDSETLVSAGDMEGNMFEIKTSGRQVFYDSWSAHLKCQQCEIAKRDFHLKRYGERWIVLNRDMSGYEIFNYEPKENDNNLLSMETDETIVLCKTDAYEMPVDDKDTEWREQGEEVIDSTTSLISSSGSADTLREESQLSNRIKRKSTRKKRQTTLQLNSQEVDHGKPSQSLEDLSISNDFSLQHRELIEFYENPLHHLPQSIAVGPIVKLKCNEFTLVSDALRHLRKFSKERYILNCNGLALNPLREMSFQDNFKRVVQKSFEGFVEEKLQHCRRALAHGIVEELLENAFYVLQRKEIDKSAIGGTSRHVENESFVPLPAVPVPQKSFSFV